MNNNINGRHKTATKSKSRSKSRHSDYVSNLCLSFYDFDTSVTAIMDTNATNTPIPDTTNANAQSQPMSYSYITSSATQMLVAACVASSAALMIFI